MIWIKSNGNEIETNDRKETVDYCKSLGWKEKSKEIKEKPKKNKRVK